MNQLTLPFHEEVIGFCQSLIRSQSVNGVDTEDEAANVVVDFAERHGIRVERLGAEPDRPCVICSLDGPADNLGVLFVSHLDTVGIGRRDDWLHDPFSGHISEGKIHGRGAIDNKGGLAAAMGAFLHLKYRKESLRCPVKLVCVPDEESGATGELGIKYLRRAGRLAGLGAVYTYPGMNKLIIGHRGVLRIKIKTFGRALHTGSHHWQRTDRSANAVAGMADVLLRLEQLKFQHESRFDEHFEHLDTVLTPTIVRGGSDVSVVPAYCESLVDIRLVPSVSRDRIMDRINDALSEVRERRRDLRIEVSVETYLPPTIIDRRSAIVQAALRSAKSVLGVDLPLGVSGPANESYLLNGYGIPTCVIGPEGEGFHAPNEYVLINSLFEAARLYSAIAVEVSSNYEKLANSHQREPILDSRTQSDLV